MKHISPPLRSVISVWLPVLATSLLSGCGIGNNQLLFVTKSNFGLDIDTTPATAEITLARREGVIGPVFEGGVHPPIAANFYVHSEMFTANVLATFAGGAAAEELSAPAGDLQRQGNSSTSGVLCISRKPDGADFPGPGEVKPFLFGTDTSVGLKVGWSGMTATYPNSLKFGYNRKEFALAPVMGNAEGCTTAGRMYGVKMPSFLAAINSGFEVKALDKTSFTHSQFISTGKSAEALAGDQKIKAIFHKMAKEQLEHTVAKYAADENTLKIEKWIEQDPAQRPARLKQVKDWIEKNAPKAEYDDFMLTSDQADNRKKLISDLKIG
jgi:hypothetical protein